jgi:hypothetical protein
MAISGSWRGSPSCSGLTSITVSVVDPNHTKRIGRQQIPLALE